MPGAKCAGRKALNMILPKKALVKSQKGENMRSVFRKIHRGDKGFTLIELLVVFTLLGVLAAIVLPNVSSLIGYGHAQASDAEFSVVQTAMDAMMAVADTANVTPVLVGAATSNMATFPDVAHKLYPNYLRDTTTIGTYYCDGGGQVFRATTGYPDLDD
jgi:type IV pilus assembly protein PilA